MPAASRRNDLLRSLLCAALCTALCTIVPFSFLALPLPSSGETPLRHTSVQLWNTSSGLPQDTIHQILETRDGFLWLATEGGLVRFDGYDFTTFDKRSTPPFSSDLVNALFEDADGHLWIATADGLLERSGTAFHRYGTRDGLPSSTVWAVGQDHAGHIWAATSAGLAQLEAGSFHPISGSSQPGSQQSGFPQASIFDGHLPQPITSSPDGTLWIVAANNVTAIDPEGEKKVTALPFSPLAFAAAPDSALWIAGAHVLLRIDKHGSATSPPLPPGLGLESGQGKVQCMAWDRSSTLWMGTSTGLFASQSPAWSKPAWRRYSAQDGLSGNHIAILYIARAADGHDAVSVVTETGVATLSHGRFTSSLEQEGFKGPDLRSLFQDREGNLWLGSENSGVAILRHTPFATLTSRDGLAADPVRSLQASETGDLWLGTTAGLNHLQMGKLSTLTTAQGLASNEILSLAPGIQHDSLWVGTPDGLSYLHAGHATTLTASDGLPDDNIRSLLLAKDHTLWIGTSHGLASLPHADPAQAQSIHTFTTADGLGSNIVGSLLEDTDGEGKEDSLWIGTLHGLSHLSQGRITTYASANGLTTLTVTALGNDHSGAIWIGTAGGGLFHLNRQESRIVSIGSADDYASARLPPTIYAILEDDTAHLWLSSATGIYRIATSDLDALAGKQRTASEIAISHFDVADGLRLQDCASGGHPEAALTPEGLLWFATQKGASVIDTHQPELDAPAPPVSIENISIDDTPVSEMSQQHFKVPAGHARLAFHYAGISFSSPYKVRYRYQLDHFDRTWIDAGTRRTAYYTNIPPGHYTFRVQASVPGSGSTNNRGENQTSAWSASAATVEFTIAPHYYQTWWFYTLLVLLLALIIWQLYLYRLRQVELRFNAVLAERGRIAREIHDTLAQDIVGISVQLELVSRLMTLSVEKARAQLQETRALVRKSLAGARSSIWDLRSPATAAGDLPTRLRDTAKQVTRDSSIVLHLDIGGTYRAFPLLIEDELLRIAQEAITNAVRHASPVNIEVSLNYHATGARLKVHDDGKGFVVPDSRSGPAGHYGIRGMHERAERARATLEIASSPGSGTTVIAEAPSI